MTDSVISHTLIFSQPFSHAEQQLLTPEAVSFLESLVARFAPQRESCYRLASSARSNMTRAICQTSIWKRLP